MSKDGISHLILWRHALAEEGRDDAARELTSHGRKQAERVGRWLNENLPEHTKILVSPAVRAQQTAAGLGRKFHTERAINVGSSARAVLTAADWPSSRCTLIVGHQPTLGETAALLLTGKMSSWSLRKGAVWWIWLRPDHSVPSLRAVIDPSLL